MTEPRTAYPWPDRRHAALCVTFDFDGESPHLWRTRQDPPDALTSGAYARPACHAGHVGVVALLRDGLRSVGTDRLHAGDPARRYGGRSVCSTVEVFPTVFRAWRVVLGPVVTFGVSGIHGE